MEDQSSEKCRNLAMRGEMGYYWLKGMFRTRNKMTEPLELVRRHSKTITLTHTLNFL